MYTTQDCPILGCYKNMEQDSKAVEYKCTDGHKSIEQPKLVYRVNFLMKSVGEVDKTILKVNLSPM